MNVLFLQMCQNFKSVTQGRRCQWTNERTSPILLVWDNSYIIRWIRRRHLYDIWRISLNMQRMLWIKNKLDNRNNILRFCICLGWNVIFPKSIKHEWLFVCTPYRFNCESLWKLQMFMCLVALCMISVCLGECYFHKLNKKVMTHYGQYNK